MRRRVNLRQIEVFKAVIEAGTISGAATALNVSQPAMSKSISQLEAECELRLFDRVRGRLAPTEQGMMLYEEIDRIFSGVQQVENAIEALHRQSQGRILIGVMPGLSGAFVQRVVNAFLSQHPSTYCFIEARSSEWIMESLVGRRLDVGLLSERMHNPFVGSELLATHAVVCIMPIGHPLAARHTVVPSDLAGYPNVSFGPETDIGLHITRVLSMHGVSPPVALATNIAPTVCEFVASGTGIALVHPLMVSDFSRLVMRRFEPETYLSFSLARPRSSRNARLVDEFAKVARLVAGSMAQEAQLKSSERPARRTRAARSTLPG